jgi:hypothetical protein
VTLVLAEFAHHQYLDAFARVTRARAGALFVSVGFFGLSGLLVGGLVGVLMRKDKWVDVPRLGLSIQGSTDSIRLSIGIGPTPQGGSQ